MQFDRLNILHLACYFSGISKVYENLFEATDKLWHNQYVYVPYRILKKEKQVSFLNPNSKIVLRPIYNQLSRVAYFYKINKAYKDIINQLEISDMDIIHAHTWFTDGGLAYELYKKNNIPYVVTIRSTDLSTFVKYFYHTHCYAKNILLNAQKVIFLSEAYKNKVLQLSFVRKHADIIEKKSVVIPNGIDSFWIENIQKRKEHLSDKIQLIYVGSFIERKNLIRLIEACDLLRTKNYDLQLNLVGGSPQYSDKLKTFIEQKDYINFIGKITDREELIEFVRRNDIFVMPSYSETFGLVYIEALSQGLPLLYTKKDGIDGLYREKYIGEAVDPFETKDIAQKLALLIDNYKEYNFKPEIIINNHDWNLIVNRLVEVYKLQ
jgi:glycosyltransferase involved in cell wall biosynthesis